jgi:hypothetical protein
MEVEEDIRERMFFFSLLMIKRRRRDAPKEFFIIKTFHRLLKTTVIFSSKGMPILACTFLLYSFLFFHQSLVVDSVPLLLHLHALYVSHVERKESFNHN